MTDHATDRPLSAPATLRNRAPIIDVLRTILPSDGLVIEVASGSGEHVVAFARAFPQLIWQPSDISDAALGSIRAWTREAGADNVRPPVRLDALDRPWPVESADAIVCINMVHISPWEATEGLMAEAARILPPGAPLYLYGPFRRTGEAFAPSNQAFDADLRLRNPDWGVRELDEVTALASAAGLDLDRIVEMPANNLSVIYRRQQGQG